LAGFRGLPPASMGFCGLSQPFLTFSPFSQHLAFLSF
jgi:hypothetical protein